VTPPARAPHAAVIVQKPYFGGRRDCEQNAEADNRPPEGETLVPPQRHAQGQRLCAEFICFDCCDLRAMKCPNEKHQEF
jgi:hypothetical protein